MTAIRIAVGFGSLGFASLLLFHFVVALRSVVLPTIRQLGQEQTTYYVLHLAGFSLSGWQIVVVESIVVASAIGLIWFAVYVLALSKSMA